MLSAPNKQNDATNANYNSKNKPLTFKDWKSLKDQQDKPIDKLENKGNGRRNEQRTVGNTHFGNANSDNGNRLNYNKNFSGSSYLGAISDKWRCNSGLTWFLPSYNLNGTSFCNMRSKNCEPINNCFKNSNSLNNFNQTHNFGGYNTNFKNSQVPERFTNINKLSKYFGKDYYGYNDSKRDNNNFDQSENFFTSDCAYPQRDMMQKPLPNPFRYGGKNVQLLQQFCKSSHTKDDKNIKNNKKTNETKNRSYSSHQTVSSDSKKEPKEYEVYIPNPKAVISGKPYIPKPKIPEQNSDLTYEEKKHQWKEYRQAMKPFKNRDFYNAKRVVQRLGKKAPSELDEKELIRLKNAQEYMAAHKARLNAKYPKYVKDEDNCNKLGELYILKTVPTKESNSFTKPSINQNCGDRSESQPTKNASSSRENLADNTEFIRGGAIESFRTT